MKYKLNRSKLGVAAFIAVGTLAVCSFFYPKQQKADPNAKSPAITTEIDIESQKIEIDSELNGYTVYALERRTRKPNNLETSKYTEWSDWERYPIYFIGCENEEPFIGSDDLCEHRNVKLGIINNDLSPELFVEETQFYQKEVLSDNKWEQLPEFKEIKSHETNEYLYESEPNVRWIWLGSHTKQNQPKRCIIENEIKENIYEEQVLENGYWVYSGNKYICELPPNGNAVTRYVLKVSNSANLNVKALQRRYEKTENGYIPTAEFTTLENMVNYADGEIIYETENQYQITPQLKDELNKNSLSKNNFLGK